MSKKKIKIGINGIGRIGRTVLRAWYQQQLLDPDYPLEIVAFNNPGQVQTYVHLLQYDSLHLRFPERVYAEGNQMFLGPKIRLTYFDKADPAEIPWSDLGVDLVIDATGKFKEQATLGKHLKGTVKKVIMCAPGKDVDATLVMGINENIYRPTDHHILSNASCTTNCLAPVAKVLNDEFGIENGMMTTVHSYTADQNLLDGTHKDLRRARAAAMSMIPTSTGAAKSLGLVIPELKGKLDGYAVRVPTPNVSLIDLNVVLKKAATREQINAAMKKAAETSLKGILAYTDAELVSVDYVGMKESSMVDGGLTNVVGSMTKVVAWYDNEAGFSNRVLDLASYVAERF